MSVPARSDFLFRMMSASMARFAARHLNGVRVALWGRPDPVPADRPLVIYSNHPSWWDAVTFVLIARQLFPARRAYAPMDAAMVARYPLFRRIGAVPVAPDSAAGASAFLRAADAVLGRCDGCFMVTAQGRFTDVRVRPLGLRAGTARLAETAPGAAFLPLAIEPAFWTERGAEMLIAFGPAMSGEELLRLERRRRLHRLETELTATMDRLAQDAMARRADAFELLLAGRPGVGGPYDALRRMAAAVRGRRFDTAHASRPEG